MVLISALFSIFMNTSYAKCVKTPQGWQAVPPFSESVTNKVIRCSLSMERVLKPNGIERVTEYFIDEKKDTSGRVIKQKLSTRAFDKTKIKSPRVRPKLIETDIVLTSNNATSDPEDRSHLVPIFNRDTYTKIKIHNMNLTKNLYGQNLVYCNSDGRELSKIQLAAFPLQKIMDQTPIDAKHFQANKWKEKTDRVVMSTKTAPNNGTELEVFIESNSNHVYFNCLEVVNEEHPKEPKDDRSTASQTKNS